MEDCILCNIAWVARDGYLDLLPLVANDVRKKGLNFKSCFLCHTRNEKDHLSSKYGIKNVLVLADEIDRIITNTEYSMETIDRLGEKYPSFPLVRHLWSTLNETDLTEKMVVQQMISHFGFWEKFLIENEIDFLFYERPSIMSTSIAWSICEKLGIKSVDFIDTVVNTMTITDSWNGDYSDQLSKKMTDRIIDKNSLAYRKAVDYLKMINERPLTTNQAMLTAKFTQNFGSIPYKNIFLLKIFKKQYQEKERYFVYDSLSKMIKKRLSYIFRYNLHRFYNVFDKIDSTNNERYFLFPIHMSGEWSNHAWMGLWYWDTKTLIKHLSRCLPPGCKLYVKEHMSMFAEHTFRFYKEIKKYRNVKLLSPFENSFKLIKNSIGICTMGSTMGFEGLMLDKPVILIGEPWYRKCPGVYMANKIEQVAEYFQIGKELKVPTDQEKIHMLYALFDISFEAVRLPQPKALTEKNISNLGSELRLYIDKNS